MLWLAAMSACSQSCLDQGPLCGATATGSTGDTGPTGPTDCAWVGTWDLTAVRCGTFDYADWYDAHSGGSMAITQDPAGGCAVELTITGPSCTRTESWHFSPPVGTRVTVTRNGVTTCAPDACTFSPAEPVCAAGELAAAAADFTIDDAVEGSLSMVSLLEETAPGCTLDLVTTWQVQAR